MPVEYDEQGNEVGATLARATGISQTPWHQREVPIARLLAMGLKVPEGIENALGGVSVQDALSALPAAGAALGGVAASPGVVTAAGGAALGGAGGEGLRQLAMRAIGASAPQSSEEAAKGIATEGAVQGAIQGVTGLAGKGLAAGGKRLMHSALKPNPSMMREFKTTAPRLVKTLLDEGVNVTPGGMEKLQRLFNATNAEIKEAVKNAPGLIERKVVASRALPTAQKMSEQVNPRAALRDVGKSVEEFLTVKDPVSGNVVPRAPLSVPEAQAMKVGTYQQIGKNYGKQSSATVETQKALARGLKEEIEAAIPKIKALNAREGSIMAAQEAVGHRVAIAGNRDPVGFAWVTNAPQTFLAALIDRSPVVKSMLARGMYKSAGAATKVSPQLIRAAVVALTSEESGGEPVQE